MCDRCGGVFSVLTDALAYYGKRECCHSCGAAAHWERSAEQWRRGDEWITPGPDRTELESSSFWIGFGNSLPSRKRRRIVSLRMDTSSGDGFYDIDGTWLPASELLGSRNYGRKKNIRVNKDGSTSRDNQDLGGNAERDDFLVGGGFIGGLKAGSTGKPAHRPVKGITDVGRINALFRDVASTTLPIASCRYQVDRKQFAYWVMVLVQNHHVNVRALAKVAGCHRDTIYRLAKLGEQSIRHKSPKGGGGNLNTLEASNALARMELRQGMHGEVLDRQGEALDRIERILGRFTDPYIREAAEPDDNDEG
jgi:hypothetical protein